MSLNAQQHDVLNLIHEKEPVELAVATARLLISLKSGRDRVNLFVSRHSKYSAGSLRRLA